MRMSSKLLSSGLKSRSSAISSVAAHAHRVTLVVCKEVCDAFFAEIGNQSAKLKSKSKCKTQEQEQELKITIETSNSPTLSSMSTSNARTSFFSRVKVFSTEQ